MSASIKEEILGIKRLQVLAWLDQSNEQMEQANDAMKSFHWQLTKARQSRPSTSLSAQAFSACDVREEFVAQYRLVENQDSPASRAPALIDEEVVGSNTNVDSLANLLSCVLGGGDNEDTSARGTAVSNVTLMNVLEAAQSEKENSTDDVAPTTTVPVDSYNKPVEGLRSRRGAGKPQADAGQSEWTVENETKASMMGGMDESVVPVVQDAMDLFGGGLAPRELQRAKEKAQEAMRLYVQAANHRRHLLSLLS